MIKHAIVRPPPSTYRGCISSHPLHHTIDMDAAKRQHEEYCRVLSELGLDLIELQPDDLHPDSCFVEDTAIIHGARAIITRMAKASRSGEIEHIERVLRGYKHLRRIESPATIEGGDVLHFKEHMICGITERTNTQGVSQASEWLRVRFNTIDDSSIIHLKSHMTCIDEATLVMTERFSKHPLLKKYRRIVIPDNESYATNTLTVNGVVLMSLRHPKSLQLVKNIGFEVHPLDMTEFEKCEGAITCLSILF